MAGYSFRLSENMCLMGIFAVSKEDTSDRFSLAFLSSHLLPSWRKVLIEAKQRMWQGDSSFCQKFFFLLKRNSFHLFLALLLHLHVLQTCLKVAAPAVGEKEQRNACMGDDSAKMSWWISITGLRHCIWNSPPVSLDASRKSHSSQVLVPEELPTIPPCKRFPRFLVTMMLRMFSKHFCL